MSEIATVSLTEGREALNRLLGLAMRDTGQSRFAANFCSHGGTRPN